MTYTKAQIKDSVKRVNQWITKNKRTPKTVGIGKDTLTWTQWKNLPEIKDAEQRLKQWIKLNKAYPAYVTTCDVKVKPEVYKIIWNDLPKPNTTTNAVSKDETYDYFCKVFGKVNTVDEILTKINNKGYGHYYDGKYTNKQCIDRIKKGLGVNCTDSCQLVQHICSKVLGYKVNCYHVKCSSGEGHVFLKLSHPKHTSGNVITRDPACVLSNNGKGIKCVWCSNGKVIDINPAWYTKDLNK